MSIQKQTGGQGMPKTVQPINIAKFFANMSSWDRPPIFANFHQFSEICKFDRVWAFHGLYFHVLAIPAFGTRQERTATDVDGTHLFANVENRLIHEQWLVKAFKALSKFCLKTWNLRTTSSNGVL